MNVLDLFSGIGGFSLGLERAGMKTIAFCEIDKFCQKVLKKHWPDVPIHEDVKTLDGKHYAGTIDIICGGYPCQPFSVAGKQKGSNDTRHLWPEMFRIIKDAKPRWIIAENVEGHVKLGLDTVLNDLESEGYTCWTFIIPACAVAAPHQRNRIWIIANSQYDGQLAAKKSGIKQKAVQDSQEGKNRTWNFKRMGQSNDVADCNSERSEGCRQESLYRFKEFSWCQGIRRVEDLRGRQDIPEPLICRNDDGFSKRVDRLKALGNAVVPQIPEILGKLIMEIQNENSL
jgi:DNA (cytosine-5)-methyltransferase 1